MARKPVKKPAAPVKVRKRSPAERKSKAIELCLEAIARGWTLARFSAHSHVSKGSLLRWMAEDTVQPRFLRAMQVKALALPDDAMEIVGLLRRGGEWMTVRDPKKPGEFKLVWKPVDAKALGVALRHLEFRMMREIKTLYQPSRTVVNETPAHELTDEQLDQKFDEMMERHQNAAAGSAGRAQGAKTH